MHRCLRFLFPGWFAILCMAQPPRHVFQFAPTGVFPISGYRVAGYSAGPGWRGGYELRVARHVGLETGFTEAWPVTNLACNRFGCTYDREPIRFLDYGLRGIAPLAHDRLELSVGLGGGYVWHPYGFSGPFGPNGSLIQYSGRVAVGLSRHWQLDLDVRGWRDPGRPTQQWLSIGAGLGFRLGGR